MLYSVKETAALSKVTIKALHHYHKIGLLMPCEISEAGYRWYGTEELERLQQILLYRELDLTLEQIKQLLEDEPDRLTILIEQEKLLLLRKQRLESMLETLKKSIMSRKRREPMEDKELFTGFESEEEWAEAMKAQHEHLKETYGFELLGTAPVDLQVMNDMAEEATAFMKAMAEALRSGVKHSDAAITQLIESHLVFLKGQGHPVSAQDFALQNRFFLGDDFHLQMLEGQQTGLAYYLSAAADYFAAQAK